MPSGSTTLHLVHDLDGNVIAEYDAAGTLVTEYVWLDERPLAVVADAGTLAPQTYWVHTDHLERPIMMTDDGAAVVWQARYLPYGEVASITGPAALDYRFPGQWFQLESGLAYNWHRHYDPTTGRYLQPDPLGMPDGPSRWAYVGNSPLMNVDPEGRVITSPLWPWLFPPRPEPKPLPNYCTVPAEGGAPLFSIPDVGSPDWCLWVKNECIRECSEMALPTKDYGWRFQRCVNQCLYDNDCGGINYPEGWLQELGLGPKPWEGWKE